MKEIGKTMYQGSGAVKTIYSNMAGTYIENQSKQPPRKTIIKDLGSWFKTTVAVSFTGKWVLLDSEYRVIDSAERPGKLLNSHPKINTPHIIFVDPSITLGTRTLHRH